jgi:hypothetical protein
VVTESVTPAISMPMGSDGEKARATSLGARAKECDDEEVDGDDDDDDEVAAASLGACTASTIAVFTGGSSSEDE